MARPKQKSAEELEENVENAASEGEEQELLPEGKLVCALTGEQRVATPQEEILQSFVEQLHREYGIALEDIARDVRVQCQTMDSKTGKLRTRSRTASLVVYETNARHETGNIIRVAVIASPGTKPDEKAIVQLEELLAGLSEDREQVFGLWTNGSDLTFRMRTYHSRTGEPQFTELTDFPAPDETLEDLERAERRPLRLATADSLLRAFKRCHDYLYGNQSMRGDRAFWQLLYLIFCKILDEQQTSRPFFVGATEANSDQGRKQISERIHDLFDQVQRQEYKDVFDGSERLELNDRALAFVAGELSRYSLLSTDSESEGSVCDDDHDGTKDVPSCKADRSAQDLITLKIESRKREVFPAPYVLGRKQKWGHKRAWLVPEADDHARPLGLDLKRKELSAHLRKRAVLNAWRGACPLTGLSGAHAGPQSQVRVCEETELSRDVRFSQSFLNGPRRRVFKSSVEALNEAEILRARIIVASEVVAQKHDSADRERGRVGARRDVSPQTIPAGEEPLSRQDPRKPGQTFWVAPTFESAF